MPQSEITCLLTIHGIGFQQFPLAGVPGYADGLHERLVRRLGPALLGDDPSPERTAGRTAPGKQGAVYVQSSWPPDSNLGEAGLERLGRLVDGAVDVTGKELTTAGSRAAHVALVYSHLEETAPDPGSLLETVARGSIGVGHYATVRGLVETVFRDVGAALHHGPADGASGSSADSRAGGELRVRSDVHRGRHPFLRALQALGHRTETGAAGALDVLRTVEDDVAAYVCRNDLRVRVRDFVRDALTRLALRPDVGAVIVNAHSQGTVVAFDVLREMSPAVLPKVRWLVTAGSPLRKYATTLSWGTEVGAIAGIARAGRWCNAWDQLDPVADPLGPGESWRRGQPLDATEPQGLFVAVDRAAGTVERAPVVDCKVDNVRFVPGSGLRAHDYWSDEPQFVAPLAAILRDVAEGENRLTAHDVPSLFEQASPVAAGAGG